MSYNRWATIMWGTEFGDARGAQGFRHRARKHMSLHRGWRSSKWKPWLSRWTRDTQTIDKHKRVEAKAQVRGTLKWWNGCRYTSEMFEVWCQMQRDRYSKKGMCCSTGENDTICLTWVLGEEKDTHVGWHGLWEQRKQKPETPYCCIPGGWQIYTVNSLPIFLPWPDW